MPDPEHAKMVLSGLRVAKPFPLAASGESVKSQSLNAGINLGETILVGNKKRFLLSFDSNLKDTSYGIGSVLRNACWIGEVLTVEMDKKGKRKCKHSILHP